MNNWQTIANAMWIAVLEHAKRMKAEGYTLQQIADQIGVGNRSVIGEWLSGNKKAENASFSSLMTYIENIGKDYREFFPGHHEVQSSVENEKLDEKIRRLEEQLNEERQKTKELESYKHKWEGHLEELRAHNASDNSLFFARPGNSMCR